MCADERAIYHIHIRGYLDDSWSDRLCGMMISQVQKEAGAPGGQETLLTGALADESELMSVVNILLDQGFSLISVIRVPV